MGQACGMGSMLTCSFGAAPSSLVVPVPLVSAGGPAVGNIMDFAPIMNIPPFSMCNSMSNPTVAAATAAKSGVFTPMPCVPVTVAPWTPTAPTVMARNMPILTNSAKCFCAWGGVISITTPNQFVVQA